jgi:hypothetical protein
VVCVAAVHVYCVYDSCCCSMVFADKLYGKEPGLIGFPECCCNQQTHGTSAMCCMRRQHHRLETHSQLA